MGFLLQCCLFGDVRIVQFFFECLSMNIGEINKCIILNEMIEEWSRSISLLTYRRKSICLVLILVFLFNQISFPFTSEILAILICPSQ